MYTIYTIPGSCSSGIVVLLEKLQIPYRAIQRNDVPDYLNLVPTNQVPALETDDGLIITEGAAIVLYLLEKHGSDMLPADLSRKVEFWRWLMFDYATLHPAYAKMFAIQFRVEIDEHEKLNVLQQLADAVTGLWKILDQRLSDRKFILGDTPTIVDYLAAIYASWGNNFSEIQITLGDNVTRMIEDIIALPEFQAGYQQESIEYKRAP